MAIYPQPNLRPGNEVSLSTDIRKRQRQVTLSRIIPMTVTRRAKSAQRRSPS